MELGEIQIRQFVRAIMPKLYELQAIYNWINELDSKKPDLLSTKNQTSNTPEFTKAQNGQIDLLKSPYYNKILNAGMVDLCNRKELMSM